MVVAGILLAANDGRATALELEPLLEGIALNGRREIAFEERRFVDSVTIPLVSRGHFIYQPPDGLIKSIEEPRRESAVLEDDRLAIRDADGVETASVDLWLQPDLRLVFGSILAVLRGDSPALRRSFWVSLQGGEEDWSLKLRPKVDGARTRIERITVSGQGTDVRGFEILEAKGTRSLIRLLPETARP